MNVPSFSLYKSVILFAAIAACHLDVARAQVDDILANAPGFKPTVVFVEQYDERVKSFREFPDEPPSREERSSTHLTAAFVANLKGADLTLIDGSTTVGCALGDFIHDAFLEDAPNFRPGRRTATFPLQVEIDNEDGDTVLVKVGSITYTWNARRLSIVLSGRGIGDVIAASQADFPGRFSESLEATVTFGDLTGNRVIYCRGRNAVETKRFGSEEEGEEFELAHVQAVGSADVTKPVLKIKTPAVDGRTAEAEVTIGGTIFDKRTEPAILEILVNGEPVEASPEIIPNEENPARPATWTAGPISLEQGRNIIKVLAQDESGNVATAVRVLTFTGTAAP